MNGNGLLNSDNILWKSSTIEDVKDVSIIKASNMDNINTKEEISPPRSLLGKGPTSGGGKNSKTMKKKIADASLKVCNAYVKEESNVKNLIQLVAMEQSMERGVVLGGDSDLL